MTRHADSNYSFNPWMRPEVRLGDEVDPSPMLVGDALVEEMVALNPPPPSAGYTPRLTGLPHDEPRIEDVLNVGPQMLMQDRDAGMQSTSRPAQAAW